MCQDGFESKPALDPRRLQSVEGETTEGFAPLAYFLACNGAGVFQ